MLFQRINRSDPEKVFMVVKAGEALLADRPVAVRFNGTDDGLAALRADAANQATAVIGLADAAISSGEYGLVQCYGFRSAAKITNASNIAAGGVGAVFNVASQLSGHLSLSVSIGAATAGAQDCAVFIRCM